MCIFMPCRYICPQSNHRQKNHLLLYRIRPVPCYVQTRPREFNHTVQRKHEMQQTVATRKIHYYLSPLPWCIPSAKTKEWLPAKYFFEYLFFFRLQAFKELYYAFSAILSHMNEPATKETDNQCNKKTTNLRE